MKSIDVIKNFNKEEMVTFLCEINQGNDCINCLAYSVCDCVSCEYGWGTFLDSEWKFKGFPEKYIEYIEELKEENKRLKEDNEALKAQAESYFTYYRAKHDDIDGELFTLKDTLNRIKTIASTVQDTCNDCQEQVDNNICNGMCNGYKLIKILEESKHALKEGNNGN